MHFALLTSIGIAVISAPLSARAADAPTVYHEGFEVGAPKWEIWAKNVPEPCTVNELGPTTERAFAGEKSLKLDVAFQGGAYCYWSGERVKIPCTGDLKLTGYLYVEQLPPDVRVGVGYNVIFPPSGHSGCSTMETFTSPTRKWHRFEVDLAAAGARKASGLLGTHDVYCYLDRIAVMFVGTFKPGQRAVVYVDELKITGHEPRDYEAELRQRVEKAHAGKMGQVKSWAKQAAAHGEALAQVRGRLNALPQPVRRHAEQIVEATERNEQEFAAEARQFLKRGRWLLRGRDQSWKEKLAVIRSGMETLGQLVENADSFTGTPLVIYTRRPIQDDRILPNQLPVPASLGNVVGMTATPGEFEPGTCVLFACSDLTKVFIEAEDLRSESNTIDSEAIDIRVVKAWYQNGISTIGAGGDQRILVPELLLKDDDLVHVDYKNQRNLVRQSDDKGQATYVDISSSDLNDNPDITPRDAARLLPFEIPADTLKQIWITVHVPDQAVAEDYRGNLRVVAEGKQIGAIELSLRVLPFRLQPSPIMQSMYYGARLGPNRSRYKTTANYKNETQLEVELRNMAAHGLVAPTTYQADDANLERVLRIREQVGLSSGPLFTLGQMTGNSSDPDELHALRQKVKKWLELANKYGYSDVYFYGMDEAKGPRLASQRAAWKAVREAGGKTFVAGYHGSFETVGDLQDLLVFAGRPDRREAAKYHQIGHLIYSYANPQCGCEQPERYRRNYGLLLWKLGFDGAMDFAYQWDFGHIWNDFDSARYRDHVMAYPTVDGVIDTIQWEGYREGVDDLRYLATLLDAIEHAEAAKAGVASAARRWLDELDVDGNLDSIRAAMIDWILKIR